MSSSFKSSRFRSGNNDRVSSRIQSWKNYRVSSRLSSWNNYRVSSRHTRWNNYRVASRLTGWNDYCVRVVSHVGTIIVCESSYVLEHLSCSSRQPSWNNSGTLRILCDLRVHT